MSNRTIMAIYRVRVERIIYTIGVNDLGEIIIYPGSHINALDHNVIGIEELERNADPEVTKALKEYLSAHQTEPGNKEKLEIGRRPLREILETLPTILTKMMRKF